MALSRQDVAVIHVAVHMLCSKSFALETVEGSWNPGHFAGVLHAAVAL